MEPPSPSSMVGVKIKIKGCAYRSSQVVGCCKSMNPGVSRIVMSELNTILVSTVVWTSRASQSSLPLVLVEQHATLHNTTYPSHLPLQSTVQQKLSRAGLRESSSGGPGAFLQVTPSTLNVAPPISMFHFRGLRWPSDQWHVVQ